MIPLIPTLALSILSLFSSGFVILHTIAPLIPDSRVYPRKRAWTSKERLPLTSLANLWLTIFDVISLVIFVWEAFDETFAETTDEDVRTASSARFMSVLSLRQICLLSIAISIHFSTRRAKCPSFGPLQWVLWIPTLVVTTISTTVAGVMAHFGVVSFSVGAPCFSIVIALLCTFVFTGIFSTLNAIRSNLALFEKNSPWRPDEVEGKACPSLAPQDIEALKDGSSWITSISGSERDAISSFSFDSTTAGTSRTDPAQGGQGETLVDSSYESSWMTEPSTSPPTMVDWSFPTSTRSRISPNNLDVQTQLHMCSCPITPTLPSAQFLGEYDNRNSANVFAKTNMGKRHGKFNALLFVLECLEICRMRSIAWLAFIWIPLSFSLPYLFEATSGGPSPIFFILSVTLSAPILAFNIIFYPLPIPDDLFGEISNLPTPTPSDLESGHKRSGSMTVVEGRRSVDVWLHKGDACAGKNKLSRATSMLSRVPKLSLFPVHPETDPKCNDLKPIVPHSSPQDSSMATSAFVAIDAFGSRDTLPVTCSNERVENCAERMDGDISAAVSDALYSVLSQAKISRVPSRRSSTSSSSSQGSRIQKEPFTSNLETIPDVDIHIPSGSRAQGSSTTEPSYSIKPDGPSTPGHSNVPQDSDSPRAVEEGLLCRVSPMSDPRPDIHSYADVQSTPEADHRSPLSFSSPIFTSTPPMVSGSSGDVERRGQHNRMQNPILKSEASQSRLCFEETSRETVPNTKEHEHGEFFSESRLITSTSKPDLIMKATDIHTNRINKTSRIPKRAQTTIQSDTRPNSANHLSHASLSSTSLSLNSLDSSRQREVSLIPLPTRLRGVDIVYGRDSGSHSTHTYGWSSPSLNDHTSELRPTLVAPPSKLVRSASDKRGILMRNRG